MNTTTHHSKSRARGSKRRWARCCLLALLGVTGLAQAGTWIGISDASQIYYQTDPTGKLWLRNLNSFSTQALGCCYNYYIDTTSPEGKMLFPILLSAIARQGPIIIMIPDNQAPGVVTYGGNW